MTNTHRRPSLTGFFAFVVLWVILATFNFGFGTSELNPLQGALTCPSPAPSSTSTCIEMTNAQFGYVTAGFTVGGFVGSLCLSPLKAVLPILGSSSKAALILSGLWNVAGGLVQAYAGSWPILALGRLLMGIGSGIALTIVPGFLNDISPPALQGSIGVLNQLSIVIGILVAQALGVSSLGDKGSNRWRIVPVISAAIALAQLLLSPFAIECPSDSKEPDSIRKKLWKTEPQESNGHDQAREVEEPLLTPEEPDADTGSNHSGSLHSPPEKHSVFSLLRLALTFGTLNGEEDEIRKGTRMIIFTQMAQQLSGINAVLYYSTGILSDVLKNGGGSKEDDDKTAKLIGLGITVVNFLMTFPPIPLIDERRVGRKRLLQISSGTMAISALALSLSMLNSASVPAAVSIVTFTAGFSAGLGAIPFLILPELVPRSVIPSASSLGIACNWLANITLSLIFLPLKDALGGYVFFIFAAIDAIIFITITGYYRYKPISNIRSRPE
ncbi:general substrate transporter [Meira miltonrushii]|uniref:General substrate transporter n=1 Tax=Meira miltonrushii TaxID=1280837 RepID=A0A316V4K4_9BASI|nr:general substrate transporter [Meira miltonrushii]PWN32476.1 general substrate transporter [Meira miltonrushii]